MHYLAIIGQNWKPDQRNFSFQLSHDFVWNKTGLTWLPTIDNGERNKKDFLANKVCRLYGSWSTSYTWVGSENQQN